MDELRPTACWEINPKTLTLIETCSQFTHLVKHLQKMLFQPTRLWRGSWAAMLFFQTGCSEHAGSQNVSAWKSNAKKNISSCDAREAGLYLALFLTCISMWPFVKVVTSRTCCTTAARNNSVECNLISFLLWNYTTHRKAMPVSGKTGPGVGEFCKN